MIEQLPQTISQKIVDELINKLQPAIEAIKRDLSNDSTIATATEGTQAPQQPQQNVTEPPKEAEAKPVAQPINA